MGESPGQYIAVTTFLLILALAAIVLRLCARRLKKVGLGWDDYTILLATVSSPSSSCVFKHVPYINDDLDTGFRSRLLNMRLCWSY